MGEEIPKYNIDSAEEHITETNNFSIDFDADIRGWDNIRGDLGDKEDVINFEKSRERAHAFPSSNISLKHVPNKLFQRENKEQQVKGEGNLNLTDFYL